MSLSSRHAIITSMTFHLTPPRTTLEPEASGLQNYLDALALSLVGKRYETLDGAEGVNAVEFEESKYRHLTDEILAWLRRTM